MEPEFSLMEQLRHQLIEICLPRPLAPAVSNTAFWKYLPTYPYTQDFFREKSKFNILNLPESDRFGVLVLEIGLDFGPQNTGELRLIYPKTHPSKGFWIVRINKITNKIFDFHNLICGQFRVSICPILTPW